jgi:hypothetical protein
LLQRSRGSVAQPDLDAGIPAVVARERARQVDQGHLLHHAEGNAAVLKAVDGPHGIDTGADGGECTSRLWQERFAGRGQLHTAGRPLEERLVQFRFERSDRRGEPGLGDVHLRSGPGEVALLRDRDEVLQRAYFHS